MKKLVYFTLIFATIIAMGSCSVDDSNDIEIIKPGDTVITGGHAPEKDSKKTMKAVLSRMEVHNENTSRSLERHLK